MIKLFENVYKTTNVELRDYSGSNFLSGARRATIYIESSRNNKLMFTINYDKNGKTTVQDKNYETLKTIPCYIQDFLEDLN